MRGLREKELPGVAPIMWGDGKKIVGAAPEGEKDGIRNGENLCGRLLIFYGMSSAWFLRERGKRYLRMFGKREMCISK